MLSSLGVILKLLLTSVALPIVFLILLAAVIIIAFFKEIALGFLVVVLVYCGISEAVDAINKRWAKKDPPPDPDGG